MTNEIVYKRMRREDVFISIYNSPTFLFFLLAASLVSSAVS